MNYAPMLRVGITGGIGSGKSIVCQVFTALGIPVFNADDAAKHLMENDATLVRQIRALLGEEVYSGGKLNRPKVSDIIYRQPEKLRQLNALVHPATIAFANEWAQAKTAPYIIKEAAIFFEAGSDKEMDIMVGVFAPLELRVQRAMQRSRMAREKVLEIVSKQMDEDEKMRRCNHVIINDDKTAVLPQVLELHRAFLASVS
jgi:dephospho-CoA kinase